MKEETIKKRNNAILIACRNAENEYRRQMKSCRCTAVNLVEIDAEKAENNRRWTEYENQRMSFIALCTQFNRPLYCADPAYEQYISFMESIKSGFDVNLFAVVNTTRVAQITIWIDKFKSYLITILHYNDSLKVARILHIPLPVLNNIIMEENNRLKLQAEMQFNKYTRIFIRYYINGLHFNCCDQNEFSCDFSELKIAINVIRREIAYLYEDYCICEIAQMLDIPVDYIEDTLNRSTWCNCGTLIRADLLK